MSLSAVISVDETKCVNCHACISACPVKYCIDGSGDHVSIIHDRCIGCGSCISSCTHQARAGKDDFPAFLAALHSGEKMVAVCAPAVASSFPGEHLRLNGLLCSMGVEAVFDVSFGAELTVKSYLEHIDKSSPRMVIAQPCPAIVTFTEIYAPWLLEHLAPADSPMTHTMKMVRRFYPQYRGHKIAVLSPCYAKRREFDEVGIGDYNVTINSIRSHLKETGRDLADFEAVDYSNPPPERAVLFSSPGGLMRTVERERPEILSRTRKIEGPRTVYPYLEKLSSALDRGVNPLLIDCLNCELGCNGGPGTGNHDAAPDEVESHVEERSRRMRESYGGARARARIGRILSRFWEPELYRREYRDRSAAFTLRKPGPEEARQIEHRMLKFEKADFLNCASCGYGSCDEMVIAIFNGLNKPENCHHYKSAAMEKERMASAELSATLHREIASANDQLARAQSIIETASAQSHEQSAAIEQSSAAMEEMIASINNSSRISEEKQCSVEGLVAVAGAGEEDMRSTVNAIEEINRSVEGIWELMDVINGVASMTNLLSMNASIEAAHAGEAGKGFAVVAAEIRRLAEATAENAARISATLKGVIDRIGSTSHISERTGEVIHGMIQDIGAVAHSITELINSLREMSVGSGQITAALASLRNLTGAVREAYAAMTEVTDQVRATMGRLGALSEENMKRTGAKI